ncbi:MAG: glycosyltransferase family 2 protein [Verrucomicrobia bacterium]|nr:glycosyltransferase family 2 protein [Verrucomicrobiota bacterium]
MPPTSSPRSSPPTLSIVVPIFNEVECFPKLLERLLVLAGRLEGCELEILFVNDGSTDGTGALLDAAAAMHPAVKVLHFSRNFGHQAALTAGLDHAEGDFVCIIDADLQDPPEIIPDLLGRAREGFDIVYAQRRSRTGESWFKKATAALFYRLLSAVCRVPIPMDTGDFRLVSRRLVLALRSMREPHRFIRGMVPWVGFRSVAFPYDRQERFAGTTKYPLMKMIRFAADAVLSFSNVPLRISTFIGLGMTCLSALGILVMLYLRLFTVYTVPGISAVICLILGVGGVQFIILGMLGEYVGRIFEQGKNRPLYVVAATANLKL